MRLLPHRASDLLPFQTCCLRALDSCEFASAHAGMSKDGTIAWIFQGAVLEVTSTHTGQRVSFLSISQLLQDPRASIVCVKEYKCQGHIWLLIACNRTVQQGLICLLNVGSSMVVKTVEVPQQITSMEPVLTEGGSGVPRWAVCEQLQQFCGIVAIGTEGSYVYLVDMRMDDSIPSSHSLPCAPPLTLHILDPRVREVNLIRQHAADSGHHLALQLGVEEGTHSEDYFHFRRPDQHTLQSFDKDEVQVTCLKYIPQIGTLAVGYNFGAFQLWRLYNPALEYSSAIEPDDLPVAYFVYQEPENDPKNFAYLWVGRDDRLSEQKQESLCSVSLYQMCYAQKYFYANYGNFYQELTSIVLRIEHILTSDPYNSRNTTTWTSQLLAAYTITDHSYHPPSILSMNDSFEDGSLVQDLSLCVFVWEAQDSRPGSSTDVFLSIFDMNRWYHAQMPSRIKYVSIGGQELCPFFAVYRLTDFVHRDEHGILVDIQVKPNSLLRFINNSPMPPEQHFYPSSLAFDTLCIFTNGLMTLSFLGIQRQVLADLEASGPLSLLQPADVYHCCVQVGLLPRSTDIPPSTSVEECQRKAILTMALEHDRVRFITNCVRSWADGEFIHQGCTLQFLLVWTWERVMALKQQIDLTSQPLYDWSGTPVDQRMMQVLESSASSLAHLRTILRVMLTQSSPITEQGEEELKCRMQVVSLLLQHLKVVIWFIHSSLLPEYEEAGGPLPSHYIYPASELTQVFRVRRAQLQKFDSSIESHKVILIDALIHNAGDAVSQMWRSEGGTGQYPPPSLRVALATYLLDSVDENIKHAIILYLLFDLAAVAHGNQEQLAEKIPQFAKAFDVPLGLVQQVHGFWLIDHMNAEEGLKQLLGTRARQDLGSWQHNCILQGLMYQGEINTASRYLTLRTPPIFTTEDVKMRLTIMVADRLVWQALDFVRSTCGANDQQEMLRHVFQACKQYKLMENLFRLPLSHQEEQYLQNFLSEDADPTSAELLVLHLLQRAQYVPAIRLNDHLRHRVTMDFSAKSRQRAKTRNVIVEGFRHALPAAQQCLINKPFSSSTLSVTQRVEVPRPKPLSTAVTKTVERRVNSQSALIMAVMDKVAEAEAASECGRRRLGDNQDGRLEMQADSEPVIEESLHQRDRALDNNNQGIDNPGPFLCTPRNTRSRSRLSLTGTVVYPSIKSALTPHFPLSNISSPGSPLIPTSTGHTSFSRSKVFTADCMSLLQTPKIDHRNTPGFTISLQKAVTPHSILKVSRLHTSPTIVKTINFLPKESQHKQLTFSGAIVRRSSNSSTPSSISSASTPSSTSATPTEFLDKTKKTLEPNMPKHLRFAEPEMREVSPTYGSPDGLVRRPLRSPPDNMVEEKMAVTEDLSTDEEITFNFLQRKAAVAELTKSDSEFSISPITVPDSGPADDHQCLESDEDEAIKEVIDYDVDMQDSSCALDSAVRESDRNRPVEEQISAGIFPQVKHSQASPPKSTVTRPQSACSVNVTKEPAEEHVAMEESQEEACKGKGDAFTELGPSTLGEERDKGGEMESARLSPLSGSSSQRSSSEQDVFTEEKVFEVSAQEDRTLHSSHHHHHHHEEIEISIVSRSRHLTREVAKTTLIIDSTGCQELVPDIECEVGQERAVPICSELETKKLCEDAGESEEPNVDGGADEDEGEYTKIMRIIDSIDVDPPTPIMLSPQRSTSEQLSVKKAIKSSSSFSTRLRQTKSSIKESTMPILQKEDPQPSPAKQRRISVDREGETEIPSLLLEAGEDGNVNDNRSRSPSPPCKAAQQNLKTATPERTRRASKSSLAKKDSQLTIQTDSSGDMLVPLVSASLSPSRRSTRHTTPVRTIPTTVTVSAASERPVTGSLERGMDIVEPLAATSGALQEEEAFVPSSPSRNLRSRSKTPELRPINVEPVTPVRRSNRRSKTPELTRVLPKPSPSRRRRQSENKSEGGSPEAEEGEYPIRRATRSSLARERASSADSTESVPASPGRPLTRSSTTREGIVSESLKTVSPPSTPSRRSLRERSKTPELSPSRQITRIKKKATTMDETTKELAAVTEQVRSSRRQKKDDLPKAEDSTLLPALSSTIELIPGPASETREPQRRNKTPRTRGRVPSIGREEEETKAEPSGETDITEFEFAAPTPVPNLHAGDKTLEVAAEVPGMTADSDVLTFTFSAPITRSTRHLDQLSSVSHAAPLSETLPGTLPDDEQPLLKPSASTTESHFIEASTRKKREKIKLRKKSKSIAVPSASPSDSPILLLSPGTEADIEPATGTKKQPSMVVGGRGRSAKRAVLGRLRKRRKVELW